MRLKPLYAIFASAVLFSCLSAAAQPQQSVADAARKAQAERKTSTKPVTVITNDDLDKIKGSISVVGPEPVKVEDKTAAAGSTDAAKPAAVPEAKKPPVEDEAYWKDKFKDARKTQADDEHELDILQREYNLKQEQYYSDPNVALREQYTRQDLTDTKTKIDDKTAAVAADKQALSDLEDALRKAGGDPGWSRE